MHADINGSFNIVRKVLKSFQYDKGKMNLSYQLVELNLQGKNKFYAFCGPLAKSHSGFYPLWNMPMEEVLKKYFSYMDLVKDIDSKKDSQNIKKKNIKIWPIL